MLAHSMSHADSPELLGVFNGHGELEHVTASGFLLFPPLGAVTVHDLLTRKTRRASWVSRGEQTNLHTLVAWCLAQTKDGVVHRHWGVLY
jgi:hypothetical protein